MSAHSPDPRSGTVQRQISLPLSKALEIAWKNIRMRLSRSLLVTSSIVLALAFLVSIQTGEAITDGMRGYIATADRSPRYNELRERRAALEAELEPLRARLLAAGRSAKAPGRDVIPIDPVRRFGADYPALQQQVGPLPATAAELRHALTADEELVPVFERWLATARQLVATRDALTAPERLASQLAGQGVAMTENEIAANRIQNRWLLGLALLVAFVGILNAMLMSVTERFREIGTMKCLGALDGFIVKLFLLESLFQGVVGTIVGLLLGLGLSFAYAAVSYGGAAFVNLPWDAVGVVVLTSLLVGITLTVLGAVGPAFQAAKMEPIAAMRVEA